MINGKEGTMIFVPTLVLSTIALLAYAAVLFQIDKDVTEQTVGEITANLIQEYTDGETFLMYLDKSAEYAANDAIYELGDNGGVKGNEACKKMAFNGADYNIWNEKCRPDKEMFFFYFEDNFKRYLDIAYPISKLEYDYEIENDGKTNTLKGLSGRSLNLGVNNKVVLKEEAAAKVEPIKDAKYKDLINKYGGKYEIEPVVLKCMIWQESKFNENAVSPCGAAGLIQLMPGAAKDNGIKKIYHSVSFNGCDRVYGKELMEYAVGKKNDDLAKIDERFDPEKNIEAGARYLGKIMGLDYVNGNIRLALASYNAGPYNAEVKKGRIPQNKETPSYVNNIMGCISRDKNKITGSTVENVEEENVVEIGLYEPNISFSIKFDYDFSDYGKIYNAVNSKIGCLKDEYGTCFKDEEGMGWHIVGKENNIVFIQALTKQKAERFNTLEDGGVVIRFGVDLNNWMNPKEVAF